MAARREDVKAERQIKAENAQMVRSLKQYEIARAQKAGGDPRTSEERERALREAAAGAPEFLAQDFINMIAMEDRRREDVEKEIVEMEELERKTRTRARCRRSRSRYDPSRALASR